MIVNASVTPTISINATSTSICTGENVTFTATTTNEGTAPTYQWQVNGANVGTNSPTYTISSLYNNDNIVCILTSSETCVTNNNVSSNIVTMTVNSTLPVSSFTYIQNGLDFNFTNTSSGATSYLWNFGDGSTSTLQDPTYTYAIPGMYIVTLTSYNICDSNQIIQSVNAIESGINGNSPTFSVGIYPNPSKGITTVDIKGSETKDAEITIHDAAGRKVFNYHLENAFGNSKVNIDISGYEKGIYYFTVRLDKESQHFQVIRK
jgi:PKD repeat protein